MGPSVACGCWLLASLSLSTEAGRAHLGKLRPPPNIIVLERGVGSSGGLTSGSCWVEAQQV